ncbi:MAG: endonuclease/exonuclease/phosphatase family protein [Caldilineaceae bacterium]
MIRVLTWNIHNWTTAQWRDNVREVADVLAAADADIIGLNEVPYPHPQPSTNGEPALDWLGKQLGMHVVFGPWQRWPAHLDMPAAGYGNALLARKPIVASAGHHLSSTPSTESRGLLEGRVLLGESAARPGGAFTVYVTHLDHTDEEARVVQFRNARQWLIRDRNRPHLLMGDINAISAWDFAHRPDDLATLRDHSHGSNLVDGDTGPRVVAAIEKAGYTDAARLLAAPGGRSYVRAQLDLRLDYLFASESLAPLVRGYGIIENADAVSDHRPVWVDLALD